jgi:hypothetical protein
LLTFAGEKGDAVFQADIAEMAAGEVELPEDRPQRL